MDQAVIPEPTDWWESLSKKEVHRTIYKGLSAPPSGVKNHTIRANFLYILRNTGGEGKVK
jgi:hypothetical protein